MNKFNKFRSIVFTITTALVFAIWGIVQPILVSLTGINIIFSFLLGAIVSLGSYRIILGGVEKLAIQFKFVKRIILGASYLEGTWVGAYIGSSGEPRFVIEEYEQDFEQLVIRGRAFYPNRKYKGEWKSCKVSIDEIRGEIAYTYDSTMEDNGFRIIGFAIFNFDRKDQSTTPYKLYGFSSDIDSNYMNIAVEEKIKSHKEMSEDELLEEAKRVYEKYKHSFFEKSD